MFQKGSLSGPYLSNRLLCSGLADTDEIGSLDRLEGSRRAENGHPDETCKYPYVNGFRGIETVRPGRRLTRAPLLADCANSCVRAPGRTRIG